MTPSVALLQGSLACRRTGWPADGAAVADAVYNATGKRVRDLPITLDKTP